jgi:peptidoglycan hydrolase-like protein with peptidoglycan-binding domain
MKKYLSIGTVATVVIGFALSAASAFASVSLSIGSLSPGNTVSVGTTVSFTVSPNGFTNPSYTISDQYSGNSSQSSVSSSNINTSGYFNWTPNSNDVGTHNLTISVADSYGNSATVTEQIIVTSNGSTSTTPAVTVQGLTPGSNVVVGQQVNFTVANFGFTNPTYTISDSFSGSNISNADINSSGYFSWSPISSQVGTHNLSINVTDSNGHNLTATQQLVVGSAGISIQSITPGTTFNTSTTLSFTIVPVGMTNPVYNVTDSFGNSSASSADINSSGIFSWTPGSNQVGSHTLTIIASDTYGHTANTSLSLQINQGPSVTITVPSPNANVAAGTTVTFMAYPSYFTNPVFNTSELFTPQGGQSANASTFSPGDMSSSGSFTWTPTINDLGTHLITVVVTDAYGHTASAKTTITVGSLINTTTQAVNTSSNTSTTVTAADGVPSTSTTGTVFTSYLSPGSTGSEVSELQQLLTNQGLYTGPVNGHYGNLTEAAVIAFQAHHGIAQLGVVGPSTRSALNVIESGNYTSSISSASDSFVFNSPLSLGSTGTGVTELQKRLTSLGIYTGPVNGRYGPLTEAAVMSYQKSHGLSQLGNVGPATRAALNSGN